ncbi:SDR family NAD(P)-dependent oxidoreductase [Sphingomonas sp. BIUV-7]|uniref:SDR family NAD(P)-dependent oxidoreductase n=1 Tax=Sphingomonas natans TaxID=3063330 RepID=A0ABT8Y6R4_9SPHN|nr:SDR family NAD(P)-dependent oxidoreductase [Sphingomonas sp. BIUV-7]MDO6413697.1 SDR family NAD(P)-dependent oxidoreductase [Sphingomonas sp. BIUV-7]
MTARRSILVTGASSGLGAGLARHYAAADVRLALIGRDAARLEATAADCRAAGAEVVTGLFDVAEAAPIGAWIAEQDAVAPFAIAIAAAGVSAGTSEAGAPEGHKLATLQVRTNLLGTMNVMEPLIAPMIARKAGQLVVVSSTAALRGLPYSPGYSASKAGVRAYGEALRALLAPAGVAVTVVVPGFFDTPMTDRWKGPTPFMTSLDTMVRVITRGIDRRAARVTHPRLLALGQQAADLMPAAIGDRIVRGFRFHIEPGA